MAYAHGMPKFNVTLKASLARGELYWVAKVSAPDEDAAMAEAERLFFAELDAPSEWAFSDADVESL